MSDSIVLVLGVWGDGTSAMTKMVEALGFPAGIYAARKRGYAKHGTLEDKRVLRLLRDVEDAQPMRMRLILSKLAKQGAVLKMPWLLVRDDYWRVFDPFVDKVIWVTRSTNSREYHAEYHEQARKNRDMLAAERWPGLHIHFDDVMENPEREARKVADYLEVPYKPEAAVVIDPDWPEKRP